MHGPDPANPYPMKDFHRVRYLRNFIRSPLIEVGDYTYCDDPDPDHDFERDNVLYHFDFIGDRLRIGRFCAIARGVRFVMNGANHPLHGFSTYPFFIFGHGWEQVQAPEAPDSNRGDTVVGNDVWIGYEATIMPGVTIGDGAIIGACAVVTKSVEPYTIVGGNPARSIRKRFDDETIALLLRLRWWDWPAERVTANLSRLLSHDLEWLKSETTD